MGIARRIGRVGWSLSQPALREIADGSWEPVERLESRVLFATFTWDGADVDDPHWQTATNWAGDVAPPTDGTADLVFAGGATQKFTINDYPANTPFNSISFTGGYSATGAAVNLGAGGVSSGGGFNPVDLNFAFTSDATVGSSGSGTL